MYRKLIGLFMAGALTLGLLAGCGSSAPDGGKGDGNTAQAENENAESKPAEESGNEAESQTPVTISIGNWPTRDAALYDSYMERKEKFEEKYPWITIEPDEYVYGVDTFLAKAASGQLPTVYNAYYTDIDKIVNAGYAADITEAYNQSVYAGAVDPEVLELMTFDGKIYGVPWEAYSLGLFCNVAIFKEAGLVDENGVPQFPATWDEVREASETIREKTGKAGFYIPTTNNQGGWLFTNIAWTFGAEFEELVDGKWTAVFDSEEAVAALQWLKDMRWTYNAMPDNIFGDITQFFTLYGTGEVAMGLCHNSGVTKEIIDSTKMNKDDMALTTVPAGPAGSAALMGGGLYMMAPNSTPEQQMAVMKWLEEDTHAPVVNETAMEAYETAQKVNDECGYPVGPTGLMVYTSGERAVEEQKILDKYCNVNMDFWNNYCEHASENIKPEPSVNAQELYAALDAVIQEVLTNENADPQELLTNAAENFQRDYLDNAN